MKRTALPLLASTVWISASEFFRNQVLLVSHWEGHYRAMGQVFPAAPLNGAVWGLWSLGFAFVILVLLRALPTVQAAALAWFLGFGLMWLVIGNLGVLPFSILPVAVPLSVLEVAGAIFLQRKLGVGG